MKTKRITHALGAVLLPIGLLAACSSERKTETPAVSANAKSAGTDADNTARNVKDRNDTLPTPMDQGSSEADRTVTQMIRKSVVAQDGFSVDAQNVKIITQDGVVTLRGPVASADEKAQIESITARADGVRRVVNLLEVETKP